MNVRPLPANEPQLVDDGWREDRAQGLESEARAIGDCLLELDNLEQLFGARKDERVSSEIRQLAGRLRTEANALVDQARELRTAG